MLPASDGVYRRFPRPVKEKQTLDDGRRANRNLWSSRCLEDSRPMSLLGTVAGLLPQSIREPLRAAVLARRDARDRRAYRRARAIPPPHIVKVDTVLALARRFRLRVMVETGTFEGEMARKCAPNFHEIHTIELDPGLAAVAARKLARHRNVHVIQGDSAARLAQVVAGLDEPALFWLDAHYSGSGTAKGDVETPIAAEIAAIDDARLLGAGDYPTLEALEQLLSRVDPRGRIEVSEDIVRFIPR